MDNKEAHKVLLHYETAGCEFCTAKHQLLFRSDDNSPSTGHLTRKALLCVFAQGDKNRPAPLF